MRDSTRRALTAGLPTPVLDGDAPASFVPLDVSVLRLVARGLAWGLLTGACTGGAVGLTVGVVGPVQSDLPPVLALMVAVGGGVVGLVVALLPSLIGACYVALLAATLPATASAREVEGAIGRGLRTVHVVVALIAIGALAADVDAVTDGGAGVVVLLCLLTGNITVHAVLGAARASISRAVVLRRGA